MRVWKNSYSFLFVILLSSLVWRESEANDTWVSVQSLKWLPEKEIRLLQVELDFKLSTEAIKALHSGITLYWEIEVTFLEPRIWLRETKVFFQEQRYSLRYDTLFNHYRVKNESSNHLERFSSLVDALEFLQLRQYQKKVQSLEVIYSCLIAEIRIRFDIESLPIPLRPVAYFSSEWDLSAYKRLECD